MQIMPLSTNLVIINPSIGQLNVAETAHTSAKARLTSVAIWIRIRSRIRIRIRDPDRHQNLIFCSLAHCHPSLKIPCKSVRKFLRKVADRLTERQTDKQRRKRIILKDSRGN